MATDDRYEQARRRFEDLDVEKRARFLLEASVTTLARGLEEAGRVLADGLEDVLHRTEEASRSSEGPERPGAAEPETAQRQTSRNGPAASDE